MSKWIELLHRDSRMQEDAHDDPLIELENLVKIYDTGAIKVLGLKKIGLTIKRREFVAIMRRFGPGKSTPTSILGCLSRSTLGHYYLDDIDVADMRPDQPSDIGNRGVGFIFQSFNLIFRTSALKNAELPMIYVRVLKTKQAVRAQLPLERVGLRVREEHMPNELFGGQRQRVAIVRALANKSPLILADEPTGSLDITSSVEIMELFTKLYQEGTTVMLVTHEGGITAFAHHVIRLSDGQIQSDKLNMARTVPGSGKEGEQDADRKHEDDTFSHPVQ